MKNIVLDTNILLTHPSILARKKHEINLVITQSVLVELSMMIFSTETATHAKKLVDGAIKSGNVQLYKAREVISNTFAPSLSITLDELRNELSEEATLNPDIATDAKALMSSQARYLFRGFLGGVLITLFLVIAWFNIQLIVSTLRVWGTVALVVISGIFLYWLRGRFRLPYGITEICVGVLMATKVFYPSFDYGQIQPSELLQILAGVYIMVRGLDNLGKALRGTRVASLWQNFSGEKIYKQIQPTYPTIS